MGGVNKGFRKCHYKSALVAKSLYHMVGAPNKKKFKMMIWQNIIQNCQFTVEDIQIEENIFYPNVFTLKVRTTRQSPKVVVDNFIEISRELIENNQELILCIMIH